MKYAIALAAGSLAAVALHRAARQGAPAEGDADEIDQGEEAPIADAAGEIVDTVSDAAADISTALFGTKYDSLISLSAQQAGIPADLLYRLLKQESHFRDDIITGRKRSPVGALGIAQFMPETAVEWCGSVAGALDPNIAIPAAARYLAYLIRYFGGDVQKGVAAYNWGMGNVQKKGLARAPEETRQYVLAITQSEIA